MKRLLALLWLACSLNAEFRISPNDAPQPSTTAIVNQPQIAASANGFLVAWIDDRPPGVGSSWALEGHVRAMRLDANGERVDVRDFEVAPRTEGNIAVASDGIDYLVAIPRGDFHNTTHLVRVPGERGAAPQPLPVQIPAGPPGAMTYASGHYVLTIGSELHVLDRAGNVVRGNISIGDEAVPLALLGTRDGRLLVVWAEARASRVALVTVEALLRGEIGNSIALPRAHTVHVAEGAHGFGLLLGDDSDWSAVLLDANARHPVVVQKLEELRLSTRETPTIARLGTGYVVLAPDALLYDAAQRDWIEVDDATVMIRINAAGVAMHSRFETLPYPGARDLVSAPGPAATAMLAYKDGQQVRVQRLALDGTSMLGGAATVASMSRVSQENAVVARCNGFDAVVWIERTPDLDSRIMLRRFAFDGRPLGDAIAIARNPSRDARVTCGRTTALVSWVHPSTRIAMGALVDATSAPRVITLAQSAFQFSIVSNGDGYTGAIIDDTTRLLRWNEEGTVVASAVLPKAPEGMDVQVGALGWNGEEYLLAAGGVVTSPGRTITRLDAIRIDRNLAQIGPMLVTYTFQQNIVVAGSPGDWLLGWGVDTFHTMRMRRDGTTLDWLGGGVPTAALLRFDPPQLSWNGTRWEIVGPHALVTRTRDGVVEEIFRADAGERLYGISESGRPRLLVYSRLDPVDGVYDLFGELVDSTPWDGAPKRRSARR